MRWTKIVIGVLVCAIATPAAADSRHAGAVDPDFPTSADGIRQGYVSSLALQPGGSYVLGGHFSTYTGNHNLIRLRPDGAFDGSFAAKGRWRKGSVRSVTALPDGKLLVAGYFQGRQLLRLTRNGALDTSFRVAPTYRFVSLLSSGKIMAIGGPSSRLTRLHANGTPDDSFSSDLSTSVSSVIELPGGDLLASGTGQTVTRLNPDGSRDPAFHVPAVLQSAAWAGSAVAQPDGRMSVLFRFSLGGSGVRYERIGLTADGSIDPDFQANSYEDVNYFPAVGLPDGRFLVGSQSQVFRLNPDGTRDSSFEPLQALAWGLRVTPDGGIVVGAYTGDAQSHEVLRVLAADGTPRQTHTLEGGGFDHPVNALAALPHGKVLAGGAFTTYNGQPAKYLTRLNSDGRLDPSFRMRGSGLQGGSVGVYAIAVQPDGKYLIGGVFDAYNGFPTRALVRLNPDGTRDPTFRSSKIRGHVDEVQVQRDGRILVGGGFTQFGARRAPYLLRLNRNGSLDRSFRSSLRARGSASVESIAVQPNGRIVVGGVRLTPTLVRLKPNGRRDESFGGKVTGRVSAVALQRDGRILIGGRFARCGNQRVGHLARLKPSGRLDRSFAHGEFLLPKWARSAVYSIAIQPNGKVLVGGSFRELDGRPARRLVRLRPDGSRDPAFRQAGRGLGSNYVSAVVRQPNGRIVVGGDFTSYRKRPFGRLIQLLG